MAMDFQMEAMALKEMSRQAEVELQQQLQAVQEEFQSTSQNADIMQEALQVRLDYNRKSHTKFSCSFLPANKRN